MANEIKKYDFASAAKVNRSVDKKLRHWLGRFNERFPAVWEGLASTPISMSVGQTDACSFEGLFDSNDQPQVAIVIKNESVDGTGLVMIQRKSLLSLVFAVLGQDISEELPERELTAVESSIAVVVLEQILATLGEAWPEQEPIKLSAESIEQEPKKLRIYPAQQTLLTIQLLAEVQEKPLAITLVFPTEMADAMVGDDPAESTITDPNLKIGEDCLMAVHLHVAALLGRRSVDANELAKLQVGDIVTFDQAIHQPVEVTVNNRPMFQGWPGRIGPNQCVKLESVH